MIQVASNFFRTLNATQKKYFQIFLYLVLLTGAELSFLHLPISHVQITLLVCAASLAKAALVGWFYMHLGHEMKGLKVILLFPLFVAFFYAVGLISDAKVTVSRHANPYVGAPPRFFGQRNLQLRQVDDFGNTVVVPRPVIHYEGEEETKMEAKPAAEGGTQPEVKLAVPDSNAGVRDASASAPAAPGEEKKPEETKHE